MVTRARRLLALVLAALVVVLLGSNASAGLTSGWYMYHQNKARTGFDNGEPSFSHMASAWPSLPTVDGVIDGEPLVHGSTVIVATESNNIYGFDLHTGAQQWQIANTDLGQPRTTTLGCGFVSGSRPQGIMGTPLVDGHNLYAVDEEQDSQGNLSFNLIKVDLSTPSPSVLLKTAITPAGMTGDALLSARQRTALTVTSGNVVVAYGSINDECAYHGYVETVSESTGAVVAQWHDTPDGTQGGIWEPSGPAIDSSGNIWISTGNGSSTSSSQYDYGDSVLEFAPSLQAPGAAAGVTGPVSFFAPGSPQAWYDLNALDWDLGSAGPVVLGNGSIFAIGKGGRAYLLNQSSLPDNSNPGGGERFSQQICASNTNQTFGGLAYANGVVYVPCYAGMYAVGIDSPSAFHVLWHTALPHANFAETGAPIVAGGFVWVVANGGSTLYALSPQTGAISETFALPYPAAHFSTPATSYGALFVADGNHVLAYAPPLSAPPVAAGYILDGWGGLHPFGGASKLNQYSYWPGWDIARAMALRPSDREGGVVVDAWGGLHAFGLEPPVSGGAYWPGHDIARAVVFNPCDSSANSGYVLDGYGGINPFGGAPPVSGGGYWGGWDIARGIVVNPCTNNTVNGYMVDGWGGLHPFWQQGTAPIAKPYSPSYWSGWDIVRGLVLTSTGSGYILDGWGGLHPFGAAPAAVMSAYRPGQDVYRGVTFSSNASTMNGGYVLDAYGNVATWWPRGSSTVAAPSNSSHWDWPIARSAAE